MSKDSRKDRSVLRGLRRKHPGNDPDLTAKFESRFYGVNDRTLGPGNHSTPFPEYPGTPGDAGSQYKKFLPPQWTQFLSSPETNWLYEEPIMALDNTTTRQILSIQGATVGIKVPNGQTLIILEWMPQLIREVDWAEGLREETPPALYSEVLAASLVINGRAPIEAHTRQLLAGLAVPVTGTRYMNRRAFVNQPTFPVCIFAPENTTVDIVFKYVTAANTALTDQGLYIGSTILGMFVPNNAIGDYFAKQPTNNGTVDNVGPQTPESSGGDTSTVSSRPMLPIASKDY